MISDLVTEFGRNEGRHAAPRYPLGPAAAHGVVSATTDADAVHAVNHPVDRRPLIRGALDPRL
jgi:hypothetical protein